MYQIVAIRNVVINEDISCIELTRLDSNYCIEFYDYDKKDHKILHIECESGMMTKGKLLDNIGLAGIHHVYGVGERFIYSLNNYELDLLGYLSFWGHVDRFNLNIKFEKASSIYKIQDPDNIAYNLSSMGLRTNCVNIIYLILHYPSHFKIKGDLIIINVKADMLPCYKINDLNKFNRLLTKLKVLQNK